MNGWKTDRLRDSDVIWSCNYVMVVYLDDGNVTIMLLCFSAVIKLW